MRKAKPEFSKNFEYLLLCLQSVLNNDETPKPKDETDWASVFYIAQCHSVAGMLSYAVNKLPAEFLPDGEILKELKEHQSEHIVYETNLSVECANVFEKLSNLKIKVIPLKGYYAKNDYPSPDMRSMSDIDILISVDDLPVVHKAFASMGYTKDCVTSKDASFRKPPFFHFEVHTSLLPSKSLRSEYFSTVWDRTEFLDSEYIGKLNINDTYLYMLEHLAKHLEGGGAGIRHFADVYLFLKNHEDDLDKSYVSTVLSKLSLDVFETRVREISYNWFSGKEAINTSSLTADFILCSCTFGIVNNALVSDAVRNNSKSKHSGFLGVKRIFKKVFAPIDVVQLRFPVVEKFKVLYPVFVPVFLFTRAFVDKNISTANISNYFTTADSDDAKRLIGVYKELGLDKRINEKL